MPSMRLRPARPTKRGGLHRPGRSLRRYYGTALAAVTVALAVVLGTGGTAVAAAPAGPVLSWTTASPAARPPPLAYAAAAYDAATNQIVLFGGVTGGGTLSGSTWIWNGSTWSQAPAPPVPNGRPPLQQPTARELASMAYDPTTSQLILFGGQGSNGSLLDDTWAWNGKWWNQLDTTGTGPTPREAAAFAYDGSGSLLLFGGTGPGEGGQVPSSTTTTATAGQSPPVAGPDQALGDTWLWNGTAWVAAPGGPPARSGAVLAYDQAEGGAVLFGGESTPASAAVTQPLGDTWLWSGGKWTRQNPKSSPSARFGALAGDLPSGGGPLLVGGEGASGVTSDAWVWTGGLWEQATVQGRHPPLEGAAGAYDGATQTMVVFGGEPGGGVGPSSQTGLVRAVSAPATTTTRPEPTTTTTTARPPGTTRSSSPSTTGAKKSATPSTAAPRTPTTGGPATGSSAPAGRPSLQAGLQKVALGGPLHLSGAGFAPGSVVTLIFHSDPVVLGTATVGPDGTFSTVVDVPKHAAPGQHRIVATGTAATGVSADLVAMVTVVPPTDKGESEVTTLSLVGLALLIPVAAYLGMAGAGVWRRRRQAGG